MGVVLHLREVLALLRRQRVQLLLRLALVLVRLPLERFRPLVALLPLLSNRPVFESQFPHKSCQLISNPD